MKPIPHFASEAEEREFWRTHDSAEYLDLKHAESVTLPNLKPSAEPGRYASDEDVPGADGTENTRG